MKKELKELLQGALIDGLVLTLQTSHYRSGMLQNEIDEVLKAYRKLEKDNETTV